MAQRSVRLESTALAGIPFALCRTRPSSDVHGLYRYDVELAVDDPASLRGRAIWKSRATLVFVVNGEETFVHGMVAELSQGQHAGRGGISLHLALVPRVWEMTRAPARGTFLDRTVPELIVQKLQAAGFAEGDDFVLRLKREHQPRERMVQHDRSDFDFIQELCRSAGLSLSFAHGDGRDVLVISDAEGAQGSPGP
ncbi:contractile injection system protein, VgrG/Pvc8 family [Sorangium sp. So ce1182]|uniref:contractile injection system protein, VgrG/Pvc8 family n=1 Tax=Sorangium sp. So ce1182 TaxID=3133334 RepID=UPI003F63242F